MTNCSTVEENATQNVKPKEQYKAMSHFIGKGTDKML